jgi:DNA-binding NtrC family response regulator
MLLVEDDTVFRSLLKMVLPRVGLDVELAASGGAALEALAARPGDFDVVVTDMHMSPLSGKDLAARIRAVHPGLPVILLTGGDEPSAETRALFAAIIEKPVEVQALVDTVISVLAEKRKP